MDHPLDTLGEQERYQRARRRVAAMKGFYSHLTIYAVVNTGLAGIDALTPGVWWVQWSLFGWGIGLLAHWMSVFGPARRWSGDWERRTMRRLMESDGPI